MNRKDFLFAGLVIGPIIPIALFLSFWWMSIGLVPDHAVFLVGFIGFAAGCAADIIFLKRWINKAYAMKMGWLIMIYLFYSVCFFGFFMGVPVCNLIVGAAAGIFMGRKYALSGLKDRKFRKAEFKTSLFIALGMVPVCLASAFFATMDLRDTALNLRGMLKLPFIPTDGMIIGLIVVGGTALVAGQYWLAKKSICWSFGIGKK